MNSCLVSKMSSFCVANLGNCSMRCSTSCIPAVVRNSQLLRAICALNLKILGTIYFVQNKSEVS